MSGQKNGVWWWNLHRDGNVLDPQLLPPRAANAPPLKNDSPHTPDFLVDGELLPTHLHHSNGRITGIHGEGDLAHLRLTLLLCLFHEERIIRGLANKHHFDILLSDVHDLLTHD